MVYNCGMSNAQQTYRRKDSGADAKKHPDFLDPAFLDENIVRIVRTHILNEFYSNTEAITEYALAKIRDYLGGRRNVPDGFWDQTVNDVLRRSTSGISSALSEAVAEACAIIEESCITGILTPDQRPDCRAQLSRKAVSPESSRRISARTAESRCTGECESPAIP